MAVDRDPAEIVANLRGSIEASQRGSRKLRAHRFRDLFGFQPWSPVRRKMVSKLLADEGIVVQPPLDEAGREKLNPGSELEVEMHFAARLFQALGHAEEQEAAGSGAR